MLITIQSFGHNIVDLLSTPFRGRCPKVQHTCVMDDCVYSLSRHNQELKTKLFPITQHALMKLEQNKNNKCSLHFRKKNRKHTAVTVCSNSEIPLGKDYQHSSKSCMPSHISSTAYFFPLWSVTFLWWVAFPSSDKWNITQKGVKYGFLRGPRCKMSVI